MFDIIPDTLKKKTNKDTTDNWKDFGWSASCYDGHTGAILEASFLPKTNAYNRPDQLHHSVVLPFPDITSSAWVLIQELLKVALSIIKLSSVIK